MNRQAMLGSDSEVSMATRPIFVPNSTGHPYVKLVEIEFTWYPGFAKTQSQKSIASLHDAAAQKGFAPLLEISSKSHEQLGVELSAFNLMLTREGRTMSVECAFQGSKIFENGGPYTDLYELPSRDAKRDKRLQNSGKLVGFNFLGQEFRIQPVTSFYDWLYLFALSQNQELASQLSRYRAFTDIAFNPKRSLNCQAHAAALYVALEQQGVLETAITSVDSYYQLIDQYSKRNMLF
jgi:hypothetical protein